MISDADGRPLRSPISPWRSRARLRRLLRRAHNRRPCLRGIVGGVARLPGLPAFGTTNRSPLHVDRIARRHLPCTKRASLLSCCTSTPVTNTRGSELKQNPQWLYRQMSGLRSKSMGRGGVIRSFQRRKPDNEPGYSLTSGDYPALIVCHIS